MTERRFLTFKNILSRRPIVIKIQPELLNSFSLNEAILLSVVDYFLNRELQRSGNPKFVCTVAKFHAKFLPFVPISTLYKIMRKLQDGGALDNVSKTGRSGSVSWNLDYERILEIVQSHSLDAKHSRSENEHKKGEKISRPIPENPPSISKSSIPTQKKGKKEPLESFLDLRECVSPREDSHSETKHSHSENLDSHSENLNDQKKSAEFENSGLEFLNEHLNITVPKKIESALSEKEVSELKKHSNDFEKDALILSEFKKTFSGTLKNFRKLRSNQPKFACEVCKREFLLSTSLERHSAKCLEKQERKVHLQFLKQNGLHEFNPSCPLCVHGTHSQDWMANEV